MGRPAVLRSNEPNPRSGGTVSEYPYDDVSGESAPVDEPVAPEPYIDEPPPPPPPEPPPPPPVEPPPPPPVEEAPPPPSRSRPRSPRPRRSMPSHPRPRPPQTKPRLRSRPATSRRCVRVSRARRESLRPRRRRPPLRSPLLRSRPLRSRPPTSHRCRWASPGSKVSPRPRICPPRRMSPQRSPPPRSRRASSRPCRRGQPGFEDEAGTGLEEAGFVFSGDMSCWCEPGTPEELGDVDAPRPARPRLLHGPGVLRPSGVWCSRSGWSAARTRSPSRRPSVRSRACWARARPPNIHWADQGDTNYCGLYSVRAIVSELYGQPAGRRGDGQPGHGERLVRVRRPAR